VKNEFNSRLTTRRRLYYCVICNLIWEMSCDKNWTEAVHKEYCKCDDGDDDSHDDHSTVNDSLANHHGRIIRLPDESFQSKQFNFIKSPSTQIAIIKTWVLWLNKELSHYCHVAIIVPSVFFLLLLHLFFSPSPRRRLAIYSRPASNAHDLYFLSVVKYKQAESILS
jgi:hypothetical protein